MTWESFSNWLQHPILKFENFTLTAAFIIKLILLPVLVFVLARLVRRAVYRSLKKVHSVDQPTRIFVSSLTYYVFLVIGIVWALGRIGLSTSDLAVFTGALGLGIGLGFQDAAKNFLSGLIMLLTKTVKPGDVITIETITGKVEFVGFYSCQLTTTQDGTAIVPNSWILNNRFINWTHNQQLRSVEVMIAVHSSAPVDQVRELLIKAATAVESIDQTEPPAVQLRSFGESLINFAVYVKSSEVMYINRVVSAYNFEVARLFSEHGVFFPQKEMILKQISSTDAG